MERRVLLSIFLSFLVLYTYQSLLVPPSNPVPPATPSSNAADAPAAALPSAPAAAESPAAAAATPAAAPLVAATAERDVRLETDEIIAIFTNRGARLKSWRLKHY